MLRRVTAGSDAGSDSIIFFLIDFHIVLSGRRQVSFLSPGAGVLLWTACSATVPGVLSFCVWRCPGRRHTLDTGPCKLVYFGFCEPVFPFPVFPVIATLGCVEQTASFCLLSRVSILL